MRLKSVLACSALAPLLTGAAEPVRLQPSSPWVVDYAKDSCRLARMFGSGKTATKLAFESTAPGQMDMVAIGRPLESDEDQVAAKFLPVGGESFKGGFWRTVDTKEPGVLWSYPRLMPDDWIKKEEQKRKARTDNPRVRPPAETLADKAEQHAAQMAFAAGITELEVDSSRRHPVILETGPLGDAMKAFDECSRDSLRDWGVDPSLEDKIVRPVWAPDPARWFSSEDYPTEFVRSGEESEVSVRLLVDASGRVTKCTSLTHFEEPKFEQIVCDKFSRRAKFEPAELADGTKVPSYYINRVIFRIAR
jgi:hypothetical protein